MVTISYRSSQRPRIAAAVHWVMLMIGSASATAAIGADVIVLANRTGKDLSLRFQPAAGAVQQLSLPADDVRPMFVNGRAQIEFAVPGQTKHYQLDPDSAYYFGRDGKGQVDMQKIGLGEGAATASSRQPTIGAASASVATITVKILVDEEEPARQFVWEPQLRKRIEAASTIISQFARVQLKVVAVDTWNSNNATDDFFASLGEFEKEVNPAPARVAIGFTSQFPMVRGRVHMAGTRGPLNKHILIREGSPEINEPERLEFLVHELGHFLGAAHSPEKTSVMRPVLGDNRAGRSDFRIRFDPVNALVVAMVGEDMRDHNVQQFADLSADTKRRLQPIYAALERALPADPAGGQFMRLAESSTNAPLVGGAKRVLEAIALAAAANRALPLAANQIEGQPSRRVGDALTEYLARQAAGVANTLPADQAPRAFLLALAIGLDDSNILQTLAETRPIASSVETSADRSARLSVLGEPTILGRHDVAGRFFAAAYLAAALGADKAKDTLLARELSKAQAGSISFMLIAADRAGVRWGDDVNRGRFLLPTLAGSYSVATFMPAFDDLPADQLGPQFTTQFGGVNDPRFRQLLFAIDQRIDALPTYRKTGAATTR